MIKHDEFGPGHLIEVYDPKTKMHGFLCIDNLSLGPGKGGIRMTPTVDKEEVFRLARTMTWKNSLAGLPFGGAKSGITASRDVIKDPKRKKEFIQAFARAVKQLSPKLYVAAPDVNMGEQDMKIYVEENGSMKSATGKPATMCVKPGVKCGIPHEYGSTGWGVFHSAAVAVEHLGLSMKGLTVAIEGFGNVGSFAAKYSSDAGAIVVATSDSKGCIYNPKGLDIQKITKVKKETRSVINYKPGKILKNEAIFELPVDILIPAALPDVLHSKNVKKIKARIVVEGANIPTTAAMEEILHKKGILVIPDFVANAGGVISSYAEYKGLNPNDMFGLVERKIKSSTKKVLNLAKKKNVKPRDAAMELAVERVRKAMKKR